MRKLLGTVWLPVLMVAMWGWGVAAGGYAVSAQRKVARPPCNAGAQVFVLEPELVATKVQELNAEGYCLERGNFTVIGSRVMIMVTTHDRTEEEGP